MAHDRRYDWQKGYGTRKMVNVFVLWSFRRRIITIHDFEWIIITDHKYTIQPVGGDEVLREMKRRTLKLFVDAFMQSLRAPAQTFSCRWIATKRDFAVILKSLRSLCDHLINFANTIRLNTAAAAAAAAPYDERIFQWAATLRLNCYTNGIDCAKLTASKEFPVIISRSRFFLLSVRQ